MENPVEKRHCAVVYCTHTWSRTDIRHTLDRSAGYRKHCPSRWALLAWRINSSAFEPRHVVNGSTMVFISIKSSMPWAARESSFCCGTWCIESNAASATERRRFNPGFDPRCTIAGERPGLPTGVTAIGLGLLHEISPCPQRKCSAYIPHAEEMHENDLYS